MTRFRRTRKLRWIWMLVLLALILFWTGWQLNAGHWHSSPTQSRAHLQTGIYYDYPEWKTWFQCGAFLPRPMVDMGSIPMALTAPHLLPSWNSMAETAVPSPFRQAAWRQLNFTEPAGGVPVIDGVPRDARERERGAPVPVSFQHADESTQAWRGDGMGLQLAAFAVGCRNGSRDSPPTTTFHHPRRLESEAVKKLIPFSLVAPNSCGGLVTGIQLFFRIEGDPEVYRTKGISATVYDGRTFAALGRGERMEVKESDQGHFLVIDAEIALFHDTPILILLNLPAGRPQRQVIDPEKRSAVYTFAGPRPVRLTLLAALPGDHAIHKLPVASSVAVRPLGPGHVRSTMYWDLDNLTEAEFVGLEECRPDGGWTWLNLRSQVWRQEAGAVRLTYYPGLQRVCFRVAGMPMLPNRREEVLDLLEVKSPWNSDFGPGYDWIAAAAQLTLIDERNLSFAKSRTPGNDRFLGEYLKLLAHDYNDRVTIDSRKLELRVKARPRPWTDGVREWVTEKMNGGDPFSSLPSSP